MLYSQTDSKGLGNLHILKKELPFIQLPLLVGGCSLHELDFIDGFTDAIRESDIVFDELVAIDVVQIEFKLTTKCL